MKKVVINPYKRLCLNCRKVLSSGKGYYSSKQYCNHNCENIYNYKYKPYKQLPLE